MGGVWVALPHGRGSLGASRDNRVEGLFAGFDAHAVEATVYEDDRCQEEDGGQDGGEGVALFGRDTDGELDGEEAEQRGEFDDGVEGDGAGVLEGITDRVADYARIMQRGTLGAEFVLDDLFRVVPAAAAVRHEHG